MGIYYVDSINGAVAIATAKDGDIVRVENDYNKPFEVTVGELRRNPDHAMSAYASTEAATVSSRAKMEGLVWKHTFSDTVLVRDKEYELLQEKLSDVRQEIEKQKAILSTLQREMSQEVEKRTDVENEIESLSRQRDIVTEQIRQEQEQAGLPIIIESQRLLLLKAARDLYDFNARKMRSLKIWRIVAIVAAIVIFIALKEITGWEFPFSALLSLVTFAPAILYWCMAATVIQETVSRQQSLMQQITDSTPKEIMENNDDL